MNAIRNLLALGKILGTLEPEPLSQLSKEMAEAIATHKREKEPPSLWQLFKRGTSADARRGLSFITLMLAAVGRSTKE